MINNDIYVKNLIKILKEHNIRDFVISPGGTNMKFIKSIQDDEYFTCYSIVDERSAVYFAIGLYLQTGRIIAMSCTSAQATRNYIPGLTEAFYKHVPILAITMCKHPRFTYQEYMQAPKQDSLPEDSIKKSFVVPFVSDENDLLYSIRVMNDAVLELSHNGLGPIQLCIPSLDNKLSSSVDKFKTIKRITLSSIKNEKLDLNGKKIMIVIGEHRRFDVELNTLLSNFAKAYGVAVYCNHLSNYFGDNKVSANLAFSAMKKEEFNQIKPDILISIGGQTGDYPFYNMLSKLEFEDIDHWRVSIDGDVVDTYDKLTNTFQMTEKEFFTYFTDKKNKITSKYIDTWMELVSLKNTEVDVPFSNVYAAQILSKIIPSNSIMQFSILNSLRVWNLFNLNEGVECYSNVAAFGIDGGMSTLIGQSVATEKDCYLIIGDLAFLYDINSLSIRHIKNNLKILLINNNGGVEFKLYQNADDSKSINRYIAAGDHFKNAKGWAIDCGFEYFSAHDKHSFIDCYKKFVGKSEKPIIFELFINDEDEVKAYNNLIKANSNFNIDDIVNLTKNKLKNTIKKIIKR